MLRRNLLLVFALGMIFFVPTATAQSARVSIESESEGDGTTHIRARTSVNGRVETIDRTIDGSGYIRLNQEVSNTRSEQSLRIASRAADQQERRSENDSRRQELAEQRCEQVRQRLQNYYDRHEANQVHYGQHLVKAETILLALLERLSQTNADTDQLEEMITNLSEQIDTFGENKAAFSQRLRSMATVGCTEEDATFRQSAQSVQAEFEALKAEAEEIKVYIQTAIRPEIISIKQQLVEESEE